MAARALVLVGRGRYQDRWHDDAATGFRVAQVLAGSGLEVDVRGTSPGALEGVDGVDLLAVVAGTGRTDPQHDGDDAAWAGFHARLAQLVVEEGTPLLALHQAANTFRDAPGWVPLVGGQWIDGLSMHPPIGQAVFEPVPGEDHPVLDGPVTAFDERYCLLQLEPGAQVLMTTRHEDVDHPVVWVSGGPGRVLYDALGHDPRSYDSPSRRELLRREADWLRGRADG
ncbi:ThuA domain-containing protein [Kineococcus sp. SYSU DK004]|uniref:ThuA domain-containing protein n=1 Tax=Kineococcus sp. SYSU DK004 TaxID=3383125 RepID=UPI003D7D6225